MIAEGLLERLGLRPLRGRSSPALARGARARRRRLRRRVTPRAIAFSAVVLAVLIGGWLWLRDSSLVGVKRVRVIGVSGPDAAAIRSALIRAAGTMTTLHVRLDQLNTAVAPYPAVKRLEVSTQFPHGIRIRVIEQVPVAAVSFGGHSLPVASDGTVLQNVQATGSLPVIPLSVPPGGARLTGQSLAEVSVLAAAPGPLLSRVSEVTSTSAHGITVQLSHGPSIYFGDSSRLLAKWEAAAAVLADSGSAAALYIDVTDPQRPAAGGGSTGSGTSSSGSSTTPATTTSQGASGGASQGPPATSTTTPVGG
jgi:cell division protein FtsQ